MAKSYYAVLGISSKSSADEIKSAYRRLSKEFHPDHYPGNHDAFLEIQEAYAVLSDAQKRSQYEQHLKRRASPIPGTRPVRSVPSAPEPLIPEDRPVDLGRISPVRSFETFKPSFDEVFDWLWRNFSSLGQPKSGRIQNLTVEVPLTPEQARRGGNTRVMVPVMAVCPTCGGRGGVGPYDCFRCAGEGSISGEMPVSISFPAGLTGTHSVAVPLGRFGIKNVHLTVMFKPADAR